jgi:hypothetical protein
MHILPNAKDKANKFGMKEDYHLGKEMTSKEGLEKNSNHSIIDHKTTSKMFNKYSKQFLIIFLILFGFSIYGCYYSYQIPESFDKSLANLDYLHQGNFNYSAIVKPSTIYNNELIITNDNTTTLYGTPLSRKLVETISVGFQYDFNQTPILTNLTNIEIRYEKRAFLNCSHLTKMIIFVDPILIPSSFYDTVRVNVTLVEEIVEVISTETETNNSNFSYHFAPKITVDATFREDRIKLVFEPIFVLIFEEGRIAFEGFRNDVSEILRYLEKIDVTWNGVPISFLRRAYLVVLFALGLLALISFRSILLQIEKKGINVVFSRNSTKQLVNIITLPQSEERKIIQMKSLQDLTKIAKIYQQPILHDGNLFIVDHEGNRYQVRKTH